MPDGVEHHVTPEIVVRRNTLGDWKRIGLVDDYGQRIELTVNQLRRLAEVVLSDEFRLIKGM